MADKVETIEVKGEEQEKVVELPKATEVEEQVGPGKKILMWIAGGLALIATGFGIFKLISHNNDDDDAPASNEEPAE